MLKIINILALTLVSSTAFAQVEPPAPEAGFTSFLPFIFLFIIFYFMLIRPQQKKAKEHQEIINNLKIGNNVCTTSGVIGKIKKIDEKEGLVFLEVSENVVITILRESVNQVLDSKKLEKATSPKSKTAKTNKKSKSKK